MHHRKTATTTTMLIRRYRRRQRRESPLQRLFRLGVSLNSKANWRCEKTKLTRTSNSMNKKRKLKNSRKICLNSRDGKCRGSNSWAKYLAGSSVESGRAAC
ncbi:unnamed protein product [Amoebophrya sp. A25]|nr:unnamed protein product [Amoebophrya sp. A25]|eukprot:GSA25T00004246001.1